MFCAELMSSMKDVPSTERMVMCSQRWKQLKQGEKDGYQKRCEQVSPESSCHVIETLRPTTLPKMYLFVFFPEEEGI